MNTTFLISTTFLNFVANSTSIRSKLNSLCICTSKASTPTSFVGWDSDGNDAIYSDSVVAGGLYVASRNRTNGVANPKFRVHERASTEFADEASELLFLAKKEEQFNRIRDSIKEMRNIVTQRFIENLSIVEDAEIDFDLCDDTLIIRIEYLQETPNDMPDFDDYYEFQASGYILEILQPSRVEEFPSSKYLSKIEVRHSEKSRIVYKP